MADAAEFNLVLVTSAESFIAKAPGHAPWEWRSPGKQAFFHNTVAIADWSIMGRVTHKTAFRPERRRIVFSHTACPPDWRTLIHPWIDPGPQLAPVDLFVSLGFDVTSEHPLNKIGTRLLELAPLRRGGT